METSSDPISPEVPALRHEATARFTGQPPPKCHLLAAPVEIRLLIYEYLLMPTERRYLDVELNEANTCIYANILATCRGVNEEACPMLYDKLIMVVTPGDIFSLRPDYVDIGEPSSNIWRWDPLEGKRAIDSNGRRCYVGEPMDGVMEPHVFARFKQIELDLRFQFSEMPEAYASPNLWIENDFQLDPDDYELFTDFLNRTNLFWDLQNILSWSPLIKHLQVKLAIGSVLSCSTFEEDMDDDSPEADARITKFLDEGEMRSLEAFLDMTLFNPLTGLSNIEKFDVILLRQPYDISAKGHLRLDTRENEGRLGQELDKELEPMYAEIVAEWKATIEGNWKTKQAKAAKTQEAASRVVELE